MNKTILIVGLVIILMGGGIAGIFYHKEGEIKILKEEIEEIKARNKETRLVYNILKGTYFRPALSDSQQISMAILLADREICRDIENISSRELCQNIFENKCTEYEYPNREICADLNIILERKITPNEFISYCNDKQLISHDMAQVHCFQKFAFVINNVALCEEICKEPIDNTNCATQCRDQDNKLILCKELYKRECIEGVVDRDKP